MASQFLLLGLIAISCSIALASDPSALQDFCVEEPSPMKPTVNGLVCKDPKTVEANDFFFSGLNISGNTSNQLGFQATPAIIPGLNTLGISIIRFDYAPMGVSPPHTHPRATEIMTVLEGSLEVGFVTSSPENRLFSKELNKGDVFVFPVGLIHFHRNIGHGNAISIAALSSQNPGFIAIANSVFGSTPPISTDILTKAFQVDKGTVDRIVSQF
jgi:quercetin dioxygenase-like cupin family protein